MQEILQTKIKEVLKALGATEVSFVVEYPADASHGDYSTNVAMVVAKSLGKSPREVAEEIVGKLAELDIADVEKIEIAGPGFVNFTLKDDYFRAKIAEGAKGTIHPKTGKKILIEYTQPNPFKEFHIGHLVNNTVGESLSRLSEYEGNEIMRVTYHGDVGLHVAKTIWALKKAGKHAKAVSELNAAYAEGDKAYENDEGAKKEIVAINKKIYDKSDASVNELYDAGRKLSFDHFEELYKRLGSSFDGHLYESETGVIGAELVKKFVGSIFEVSEGATIFPGEKYGLHTRVFLNSEGLPTYEAKDLGLAKLKTDKYSFDLSITVTDVEQASYFTVLKKVIELVFPELLGKVMHVPHGRLRLSTGRMSSRTGTIIGGEALLNDLQKEVLERMKERDINDKELVADKIAIAAFRYAILRQSPGSNIIFDPESSLSLEGDSGPYLQYSYTRARSVLGKSGGTKRDGSPTWETTTLEKKIVRFSEVTKRAAYGFSPHYLVTYLTDLASEFNTFYAKEKIIDAADPHSPYKLLITETFARVMEQGLWLLGIDAPEKM